MFDEVLERLDNGIDPLSALLTDGPQALATAVGATAPNRPRSSMMAM